MIYDDIWWYMMIYDDVWWCMMMYDIWWYMKMYDIWWYMMIYVDIWWYIYTYIHIIMIYNDLILTDFCIPHLAWKANPRRRDLMGMTPLRVILQAQRVPSKPMGFFLPWNGDLPGIWWWFTRHSMEDLMGFAGILWKDGIGWMTTWRFHGRKPGIEWWLNGNGIKTMP